MRRLSRPGIFWSRDSAGLSVAVMQAEAQFGDAERLCEVRAPIFRSFPRICTEHARDGKGVPRERQCRLVNAQRQWDAAQAALEMAQAQVVEAQAIHKKDMGYHAERYRLR